MICPWLQLQEQLKQFKFNSLLADCKLANLMVNNSEINLKMPVETIILDVGGMKCAGCVKAVERQLTQESGVISACVNLVTEMATVECQVGAVNPVELAERLTATGFPSQPRLAGNSPMGDRPYTEVIERQQQEIRATIAQLAIAALLIILSGVGHIVHSPWLGGIWFHFGLATTALLLPGRGIILDGWRGWWHGSPNMNTLVGLGALSAYLTSTVALLEPKLGWECFFDEPVMLLGFILLGRTLEKLARHRAAASLQALLTLKPTTARLLGKSADAWLAASAIEIPADRVRVGEFLQVLPGEKIPVDGVVVLGNTTVNESMLTGEAIPVAKQPGDLVTGGTLNQSGAIAFRVTRTGSDTTLAQIIRLVEQAQTRKAPVQQLADTVAGYFTYGVMTIATLTFLFWYFAGSKIWPDALAKGHSLIHGAAMPVHPSPLLLSLKLAIAVLVIACPCALGLATPTALLVGTGVGAQQGLLIRGGDILERVQKLDTVVFDKTGTLTAGEPVVTDCVLVGEVREGAKTQEQLLQLAASAEQGTNHPLARAILQAAAHQGLPLLDAKDFYTEPGLGISATVEGEKVLVGTAQWLTQHGITLEPLENQSFPRHTLVYVAQGNQLIGYIALEDQLRPDAQETIHQLQQMGLRVLMLTGDRPETAHQLGLEENNVLAGILPAAKAQAIANLQTAGHIVAMVGDGINDAPALAQADIGISLHSSTDIAIETADIILMRNCLMDVVKSIQLSRATFNKIRQNLFWAFAYNTLGIPIAAGLLLPQWGIILSPSVAGAIMAFSSVSVVTNSLLLRRAKLLKIPQPATT